MQQAVLHQFSGAMVELRFKCRNQKANLHIIYDELIDEINELQTLYLHTEEEKFMRNIRFMKSDYIDFLRQYRYNAGYVSVRRIFEPPGGLEIVIRGPWLQVILFEVKILAIINELYFFYEECLAKDHSIPERQDLGRSILKEKIKVLKEYKPGIKFLEFGTRRRFSGRWQQEVVQTLKSSNCGLVGTSNVNLAREFDIKPMGTMAHEWLQACQALGPNLRESQKFALQAWVNEYRGDLGIALTDVIGIKAFLNDFDSYFAKLYDGGRHDSGDPFIWGRDMIQHYLDMKIDPSTKTLVWSDKLTFPLSVKLDQEFRTDTNPLFGIGTYLTNDFGPKHPPLDIVLKMTKCNGQSVAKLSDSEGKSMSDDVEYLAYLRKVFQR